MKKELILHIEYEEHSIEVPYVVYDSQKTGPTFFISGGIHGNEVNGIFAARESIRFLDRTELKNGRVVVFPILNVPGFNERSRRVPFDGRDLNRQFEVESVETFSEHYASILADRFLKPADIAVDFHDAGDGAILLPHARIHRSDADNCVSCSRNLARMFGTEYILERDGDSNMMAVAMNRAHSTPVVTVEIGGAYSIHRETRLLAIRGIRNILSSLRMIEADMEIPDHQQVVSVRSLIRSKIPCIIELDIGLEDFVHTGQIVGSLYDPVHQVTADITTPREGKVFSVWPNNQIPKGRTIFSLVSNHMRPVEEMEGNLVESLYIKELAM